MASIVLFNGMSANNVIRDRVLLDAGLLEARGHDVMVIDLAKHQQLSVPRKIDLFIGYQGWGHNIKLGDGSLLVERFGCPYAVMLCDHPIQHADRIPTFPANTVMFVASRNQRDFLRQALGIRNETRLFTSTVSPDVQVEPRARDIGAIVVGQAQSPDAFLAAQTIPPAILKIIREFLERWQGNPKADPVADFMRAGFQRVFELLGDRAMAISVARLIDLAARHSFRWRYVEQLRKLPVTFVGDDWVAMERRPDDAFTALPSVPHSELAGLYARAHIGLNLFAPYFDFHERITETMAQGTALATFRTEWLEELFAFGREILALPEDAGETGMWLETALADKPRLEAIGAAGRARILADFHDEARIDLFEDLVREPVPAAAQAHG